MLEIERIREGAAGTPPSSESSSFVRVAVVRGEVMLIEALPGGEVRGRPIGDRRIYSRAIARLIARRRRRVLEALAAHDQGEDAAAVSRIAAG